VYRYVARRAGTEVADDVVADTFLIAFEHRDRFDLSVASALPWLFGIATNALNAHRRREARHLRALASSAEPEGIDGGLTQTDERADATHAMRLIAARVRALPVGERDVLLLSAWADLTHEQIATAMGIPVGRVRSRLFRARRALRIPPTTPANKEHDSGRNDAAATA
jgi:RNA polymerase sigma factor (sigma-70 family)